MPTTALDRTQPHREDLGEFFDFLGPERSAKLEFVVSDMWKAFLSASRERASQATHILDRFHVVKLLNKGIDEVRRAEERELRAQGDRVTLKHTRWLLLKRRKTLTGKQRGRLKELMRVNLKTSRP